MFVSASLEQPGLIPAWGGVEGWKAGGGRLGGGGVQVTNDTDELPSGRFRFLNINYILGGLIRLDPTEVWLGPFVVGKKRCRR